jgi:hypothetical protein
MSIYRSTTESVNPAPITYTIDSRLGVIFETWTGAVTAADLRAYWTSYMNDPQVMALRITLADLRRANIQFSGDELNGLVCGLVEPKLQGRQWKTAILVANPVQFGISRQYHAFAGLYSNDSIFADRDLALCWLIGKQAENPAPRP